MLLSGFILGLLGSFHCIGMCGPIAFMLPVNHNNHWIKLFQIFVYHTSRILAYAILGLFFGLVGKSLNLFGIQQYISIAVGVLMIAIVLIPQQLLTRYSLSQPLYRLISKVKSALGGQLKKRTPDAFFTIGFLNGFLPCGLVYMAIFGALAVGGVLPGILYMFLFGLGTLPLMTAAIYLGNFLSTQIRNRIRQLVPVFIILIGILFILRGLGLGIPYLSPQPITDKTELQHH